MLSREEIIRNGKHIQARQRKRIWGEYMASLSGILESAQSLDKKVSELATVRDRAERDRDVSQFW